MSLRGILTVRVLGITLIPLRGLLPVRGLRILLRRSIGISLRGMSSGGLLGLCRIVELTGGLERSSLLLGWKTFPGRGFVPMTCRHILEALLLEVGVPLEYVIYKVVVDVR